MSMEVEDEVDIVDLDEEKVIEETLERLLNARNKFDSKNRDYFIEPAMGTHLF